MFNSPFLIHPEDGWALSIEGLNCEDAKTSGKGVTDHGGLSTIDHQYLSNLLEGGEQTEVKW